MQPPHRLWIPGPAGRLEAIYQPGENGRPSVVLCHPHPLYGGTMRNKVVYWMARAMHEMGLSVLRFNFRGVEGSEGAWDEGRGETEDARAALTWLEAQGASTLWVAGFSFGCYAGLRAALEDARVTRTIAVAPAVHMHDFGFMLRRSHPAPCAIIAASEDEIVPFDALRDWAQACENHEWYCIEGAGHFFPRHSQQLQDTLRRICVQDENTA